MNFDLSAVQLLSHLTEDDSSWSEEDNEPEYTERPYFFQNGGPKNKVTRREKYFAYDLEKLKNSQKERPKKKQKEKKSGKLQTKQEKSEIKEEEKELCTICYDTSPSKEVLEVSGCHHRLCLGCVANYLRVSLQQQSSFNFKVLMTEKESPRVLCLYSSSVFGLRCPFKGCQYVIDIDQLQGVAHNDNKLFETFENRVFKEYVDLHLRAQYTKCPKCSSIAVPLIQRQETEGEGEELTKSEKKVEMGFQAMANLLSKANGDAQFSPQLECVECRFVFCCSCLRAHPGRCLGVEFNKRELLAWSFIKFLKLNSTFRLCPRCAIPIEKNGGCNHMHCQSCQLHFSWEEAPYTSKVAGALVNKLSPLQRNKLDSQAARS